jgi:hypothetical protein
VGSEGVIMLVEVKRDYIESALEKYRILYWDVLVKTLIPKAYKLSCEARDKEKLLFFFKKKPIVQYRSCDYYWYLMTLVENLVYTLEDEVRETVDEMISLIKAPSDKYLIGAGNVEDVEWIDMVFTQWQEYQKEQSRALAEVMFNEVTEEDTGDIV